MTKEDFNFLMSEISDIKRSLNLNANQQLGQNRDDNIFDEIKRE